MIDQSPFLGLRYGSGYVGSPSTIPLISCRILCMSLIDVIMHICRYTSRYWCGTHSDKKEAGQSVLYELSCHGKCRCITEAENLIIINSIGHSESMDLCYRNVSWLTNLEEIFNIPYDGFVLQH